MRHASGRACAYEAHVHADAIAKARSLSGDCGMSNVEPPDQHAGDSAPPHAGDSAPPHAGDSAPPTTARPLDDSEARPPAGPAAPPPAAAKSHRSRGWIAATVILVLALLGVGAWALSLRADNDDKDAKIASQEQQLEEQQGVADNVQQAASGFADDVRNTLSGLGDQLDEIEGTADQTQEGGQKAIDQAEQAAADAVAKAEGAGDEVDKAEAEAEAAKADAEATTACAQGYLGAIKGAFDAGSLEEGVAQARSEIEAISGSCSGLLGS